MAPFPDTGNSGRTVLAVAGDKFSVIEFERSLSHASGDPKQAVGCACVWSSLERLVLKLHVQYS